MITNIIFDLGNVLLNFKPSDFLTNKKYPETKKNIILRDIFAGKEWALIDNGDITTEQAIESISLRSSLIRDEIASIFNLRVEMMSPVISNIKLLYELKKRDFRLYYLSNFPYDVFKEVYSMYEFFSLFDGGILSSEAKVSKPLPGIYRILLEKYSLKPNESLFIDDLEINVKAAEFEGINGFVTNGSADISPAILEYLINNSSV
jgi:glucose-1-phosphatase